MKKRIIILSSIIIIIDFIVPYCWIFCFNANSFFGTIFDYYDILPLSFFLNLIIAFVLYLLKKHYVRFFIINAFVSFIIMWFLFAWKNKENACYEYYSFSIEGKIYEISKHKVDGEFSIMVENKLLANSWNLKGWGTTKVKNDTIHFLSIDSCQYYIYGDTLYNFEGIDKIKVKKVY